MGSTVWPMLQSERERFVRYLRTLAPGDWDRPSLAAGWRVKDVLAHVVAGAKNTPPKFIAGMVSSGFKFNAMNEKGLRAEVVKTPEQLIAELESLTATRTQPGGAMVGEALVHSEDIRRALDGPALERPPGHVIAVADYYKRAGPPIRAKKRIAGVTLQADDQNWSTGEGPMVTGPLLSLVLAMTGRRVALDDLRGEGLSTLKERA